VAHRRVANLQSYSSRPNEIPRDQVLRERYFLGVVLFITSIAYLGTLQFMFVYDDLHQIVFNPFIKSWRYAPQYFVSSVWKQMSPMLSGNYYRPLFLLWLRINNALFGLREAGWHLTAVLLHVLVTFLVYCVVKRLTGRFTVAWLTALIFGLHPIHHEVVAWVSGTTESLFATMFLAAFLAYLNSLQGSRTIWLAASAVLYGLALLCKETAIVLPALVFACDWISGSCQDAQGRPARMRRFGRAVLPSAFYLPVAVAYLIERARVLSGFGHALTNISVSAWLLTLPSILVLYVKHWLFPVRLTGFYDLFYQFHLSLRGVVLPAVVLLAIAIALWMLRKPLGIRETGYAVAWVLIPLLPAMDTFVFGNGELVHDRYFYVPSIGASLLVALIIEKTLAGQPLIFGQPSRIVGAALALSIVLGLCAVREASYWMNDLSLFSHGIQIAPLNSAAVNNLAAELMIRKENQLAQTLLETAYQNDPQNGRLIFNLGRLYYAQGQYSKSEKYARETIRLDPYPADSYILLGQALLKQDRVQEAIQAIQTGVKFNPNDPNILTIYGIVLKMKGDCAGANARFEEAIAINPTDPVPHLQMLGCGPSSAPTMNSATKPSQP
jgi:protein O-mannosyl-transferase